MELFRHFSLEVHRKDELDSVGASLSRYFAAEMQEVNCERCRGKTAQKTSAVTVPPRALLLHLKRFSAETDTDGNMSWRKNKVRRSSAQTFVKNICRGCSSMLGHCHSAAMHTCQAHVVIPAKLNLGPYCAPESTATQPTGPTPTGHAAPVTPCVHLSPLAPAPASAAVTAPSYRLAAVVHHLGGDATCGHYVTDTATDITRHGEGMSREWTRYDDATVSGRSAKDVYGRKAQQTAYMLLYEQEA